MPYQKPMLRQIKWSAQTGPITKNGVEFCVGLRASYKELI